MNKFIFRFHDELTEVEVQADTFDELKRGLTGMNISVDRIDRLIERFSDETMQSAKQNPPKSTILKESQGDSLGRVLELGNDGTPHILVSASKLTAAEAIGLILYAKDPSPMQLDELKDLVSLNWKPISKHITTRLKEMKQYVIREGKDDTYAYRLSGFGRNWIRDQIIPKLLQEA